MLRAGLFTSSSDDDSLAVDKVNQYEENLGNFFRLVGLAQNFNSQKTVTIELSVTNVLSNYMHRVYDAVPTCRGAPLFGMFENLNAGGISTLKVDVIKSAKNIY